MNSATRDVLSADILTEVLHLSRQVLQFKHLRKMSFCSAKSAFSSWVDFGWFRSYFSTSEETEGWTQGFQGYTRGPRIFFIKIIATRFSKICQNSELLLRAEPAMFEWGPQPTRILDRRLVCERFLQRKLSCAKFVRKLQQLGEKNTGIASQSNWVQSCSEAVSKSDRFSLVQQMQCKTLSQYVSCLQCICLTHAVLFQCAGGKK